MALAREAIEAHVETTLKAVTIGAGYNLPKDLRLVTRQLYDYDETAGQRPAAIIQFPELRSELIGTGGVQNSTLSGRIVFYFDLDMGSMIPATYVNRYVEAARAALQVDRSRGGYAYHTGIVEEPTAALWKTGQALEATVVFEVLFMHDGGT